MTARRPEPDYQWLDTLATVTVVSPRNLVEIDSAVIDDARRALKEIWQLRVEVERLETRNDNQRKALADLGDVRRANERLRLADQRFTVSLLDEIRDRSER